MNGESVVGFTHEAVLATLSDHTAIDLVLHRQLKYVACRSCSYAAAGCVWSGAGRPRMQADHVVISCARPSSPGDGGVLTARGSRGGRAFEMYWSLVFLVFFPLKRVLAWSGVDEQG